MCAFRFLVEKGWRFRAVGLALLGMLVGLPGSAGAATRYVRAGANGSGSGSDWTNAYTSLPATLVRGDTYYLSAGTYGGYTFDDAQAGTTFIYVKKATAADHGTETGWNVSYADGPAELNPISFSTSYYEIDGQTGGGSGSWNGGFGIRVRVTTNAAFAKLVRFNQTISNITLRHIDFSYDYNDTLAFPAGDAVAVGQDAVYGLYDASNITFSHCRFNRAGRVALGTRSRWSNITIEHTFFRDCTIGTTATQHGEIWSANHTSPSSLTNVTFRHNYVNNFRSTGCLIMSGGDGIYIYGNIFRWTSSWGNANGVIANWTAEQQTRNVFIYNNTFAGTDGYIGIGNTSGWVAQNNLFFKNTRVGFANTTHDYNRADVTLSEPNGQTSSANPFVDYAGADFRLAGPTAAGNSTLGAPYNTDLVGNPRGADGLWDMGAYEYVPACAIDGECTQPPACRAAAGARCIAGSCSYPPKPERDTCDDGLACTTGDQCDGAGACLPASNSCDGGLGGGSDGGGAPETDAGGGVEPGGDGGGGDAGTGSEEGEAESGDELRGCGCSSGADLSVLLSCLLLLPAAWRRRPKQINCYFLLALLSLGAASAEAANHHVRAGAAGANDGTSWTNAYTSLPTALVRGDTYYVAGGSYAGRTFDTAMSGSIAITIKGATIADHGSDVGWNNSYSVDNTQATWTSGVTFNTSNWVFDGSVGPVMSKSASQYGFAFTTMRYPVSIYNTNMDISGIKVSHVAATAPAGDVEKFFVQTDNSTRSVNGVTISHNYGSGWSNFIWATSPGQSMSNWLVEYNVVLDGFSSAANHGEDINNNFSNLTALTVRYNWFEGRTSGTACIVVLNDDAGPYYIYGNVFKDMRFGDGCITGVINGYGTQEMTGVVYNNTFVNVQSPYGYGGWIGTAVQSTVYNNLLYNMTADMRSTPTHDYNAYFSTTNTPPETNRQAEAGNPFTNLSDGDVTLVGPTSAGITLQAPYNVDAFGNVRGADGVWDRGAFEFVSGNAPGADAGSGGEDAGAGSAENPSDSSGELRRCGCSSGADLSILLGCLWLLPALRRSRRRQ